MTILSIFFLVTALIYSSVGFGGGSTYLALLLLWGIPYTIFPIIALACNIIVVSGNSFNYIRAGNLNFKLLLPYLFGSIPFAFIGGSIVNHGGQNPIEPLSKGCFVLSGQYINNFSEIYADLEKLSLAKVLKGKNFEEIGSVINKYLDMKISNETNIKDYFDLNTKQLSSIIDMVEEC